MRPLDLFRIQASSKTRAVAIVCAWILGGCCNSGSKTDATSGQADASPASSVPFGPTMAAWESAAAGTGSAASSATAAPSADAPPAVPEREIAGASHILVAYKGAENAPKTVTRSKDDAKKRAEDVLKQIRADESKFAELVKKYSDDEISKNTEGRLGNFERNVMPPTFSDTCFAMKVDTISDVVETPRGFHIIKRTK